MRSYVKFGPVVQEMPFKEKVCARWMDARRTKIVCEYDQEIPQSQTADNPVRKSRSIITRHQEDKLSKATSPLFPIKIIAILKWT